MVTEEQVKEEEAKKKEHLVFLPPPPPEEKPKEKTASIVEKIIENLEQTYREEKVKEIETLYNAFVDAITSQTKPHISNILTALELVKHNVLSQKLQKIIREQELEQIRREQETK